MQIHYFPIEKLIPYNRSPRKNDHVVDKMVASITEYGFPDPVLARSDGEIVDGHLRWKAAKKLGMTELPVILCDHWTPAQVKAFRLMAHRSVNWATVDEHLLGLEITDLKALNFDLKLTGFDPIEIDRFLLSNLDEQQADTAPQAPQIAVAGAGDLWLCGSHRVLCADSTSPEAVATVLGERKPILMVTDPPYGVELDSEWRDRAGLNGCGPAEASDLKRRMEGHTNTSMLSDTRADWSEAFALVPSVEVAYVWHASKFTREVLDGLLGIGFIHHQQIIWRKTAAALTRTHYWFQHEPCWYVRKKNAPWFGKPGENTTVWDAASPKMIMGGSEEEKFDHPTQKPITLMRKPIVNHTKRDDVVYEPFLGSGTTLIAAEVTGRVCCGLEIDPRYVDVTVKRWEKLTGKLATLENDGRSFDQIAAERGSRSPEGQ